MIGRFDVLIIGGGPSGTATALALARCGLSVAVAERSHYDSTRIGETLPPIAQLPLAKLRVWERFVAQHHAPSPATCSAWGAATPYEEDFMFSPYGHGWHLDRRRFDAMLASAAEEAGANIYRGARLTTCRCRPGSGWSAEFAANGESIGLESAFIVDASGRASGIARRLGAKRMRYDQLVGLVRFLTSPSQKRDLDQRTLVEAVEDGWWYSAWLPDNRLIVASMVDANGKPHTRGLFNRYWQMRLEKAPLTRSRVSDLEDMSEVISVAADSSRLDCVIGENWLAVGDAAFAYDPLSSLGICHAIESGLAAARAIANYLHGHRAALPEYKRWVDACFDEYLMMRRLYYSREQRWPDAPFWQCRQLREGRAPKL